MSLCACGQSATRYVAITQGDRNLVLRETCRKHAKEYFDTSLPKESKPFPRGVEFRVYRIRHRRSG